MVRSLLTATAAVLLLTPSLCQAAKVKVWQQNAPGQFEKAQFKQAVVTSEGALRLSRQLRPLTGLDAAHVWDVVEDRDGNLFVATGDDGKVFKITPDGKSSVVYTAEDSQVLCLALAADGAVYAGTGPTGRIVRIDAKGAQVVCATEESYIWCLAVDAASRSIFAGTGPKGRVYRIAPEGKPTVFYTTKQEHVLCLALGTGGAVYAGTDKNGLIYRIDAKGKGFVLYNSPQSEIRTLLVTPEAVYAGTSSPNARRRPGSSGSIALNDGAPFSPGSSARPTSVKTSAGKPPSDEAPAATNSSALLDAREGSRSGSGPASSPPSSGENSVYRIAPDGTVREIFREKGLVLSLMKQGSRLYVGTGMDGQLFEVDENTRERTEIARLDHGQILRLCRRHDGSVVIGTGDPGKLYVLEDKFAAKGAVVSEVLDAKIISKWGALRWQPDTPAGTTLSVAARSGNVAEPDETWSDWSAEQADAQQATIVAPAARFLQYRVTLATTKPDATPALHNLSLRYMTTNQAPEVSSIDVPDLDVPNSDKDNPKKLRLKWTASDPNDDELTYALYVRKEGWQNWVQLEDALDKKEYEWDTTTTPSGIYQLKIVASDRKDNADEDALTAERISIPFPVAHTPPTVTLKVANMENDAAVVEASANDPLVRLTSASFAVNGKKWTNVFPTDGLFDSKSETFKFKTETLKPGTYVIVLRVKDAAGNVGSGDVVFNVKSK